MLADPSRFLLAKGRQSKSLETDQGFLEEVASGNFTVLSAADFEKRLCIFLLLNDLRITISYLDLDLSVTFDFCREKIFIEKAFSSHFCCIFLQKNF